MKKKVIPMMFCAAVLCGCRSLTSDDVWSDYCRYYSSTGVAAVPLTGAADVRKIDSGKTDSAVESLKAQGYVVLGSFKIADGTNITQPTVAALAKKLNAGVVVWSSSMASSLPTALPNPDLGIVGIDNSDLAHMNARRPDESFAEQTIVQHTIYMLGKKQ